MTSVAPPTTDLDPADPAFLADPYTAMNALRESTTPVAFAPSLNGWVVTRHADIFACQRDKRLGRVYEHRFTADQFDDEPKDPRWENFWQAQRFALLELEPPDHTRIRQILAPLFTPRRFARVADAARARAVALLEPLVQQREFDLLADYAMPYSVGVVSDVLGAPHEYESAYLSWEHAYVQMFEVGISDDDKRAADTAAKEFMDFARGLIAERRGRDADDVFTQLVNATVDDGTALSDDEIVSSMILLLNAGHAATVNATGNGIVQLLRHRDQWQHLVDGDVPASRVFEEIVRFDPPVQLFHRYVLDEGVVIGETPVPFGSRISMLYGAGNRDPRVFDDPDTLDVTRVNASRHVNFGGGIHACLGAPLARVEVPATFDLLARMCPDLEIAGSLERHDAFVAWGYRAVPVALS